jgi:thiaminase/transcriptional activator TenA
VARIEAVRSFSQTLPESCAEVWSRAIDHPFMQAVADGTLEADRFHVWIQQDRWFVEGLTRFVADLIAAAPAEDATGLESGLAALGGELDLFREYAEAEAIRLDVPTMPVCRDYVLFLRECAGEGYDRGLVAYYACERAYFDAWTRAGKRGATGGPYAQWVENWTSEPFRRYVDWLGSRLDEQTFGYSDRDADELRATFRSTVEFEVAFWDACSIE